MLKSLIDDVKAQRDEIGLQKIDELRIGDWITWTCHGGKKNGLVVHAQIDKFCKKSIKAKQVTKDGSVCMWSVAAVLVEKCDAPQAMTSSTSLSQSETKESKTSETKDDTKTSDDMKRENAGPSFSWMTHPAGVFEEMNIRCFGHPNGAFSETRGDYTTDVKLGLDDRVNVVLLVSQLKLSSEADMQPVVAVLAKHLAISAPEKMKKAGDGKNRSTAVATGDNKAVLDQLDVVLQRIGTYHGVLRCVYLVACRWWFTFESTSSSHNPHQKVIAQLCERLDKALQSINQTMQTTTREQILAFWFFFYRFPGLDAFIPPIKTIVEISPPSVDLF